MPILIILLVLFVAVPFVELVLLLWVADVTSWRTAVLIVLATGVGGAILARWQGAGVYRKIQMQLEGGKLPSKAMVDGLLIMLAGVLLITPGILTDSVGFLLLFPPTRALARNSLIRWLKIRVVLGHPLFTSDNSGLHGDVIDSSAEQIDGDDPEEGPVGRLP